jgi:hypothetical protein
MARAGLVYAECEHITSTMRHQKFYLNVLIDFELFVNLNAAGKA